ncbi:acylphosphatase [Frateuria sp. GZRR35]|uniref:acylphosphatase n=1 Tax=unclassified Frateuria TaxID=2648894 RepID=UPI003EDC2123
MAAARFLLSGRVQGVFYRASTREQARRLDLTGHARNLPDGCVEVLAYGPPEALDALERWLWQGPPAAKVEGVQREAFDGPAPRDFTTG